MECNVREGKKRRVEGKQRREVKKGKKGKKGRKAKKGMEKGWDAEQGKGVGKK